MKQSEMLIICKDLLEKQSNKLDTHHEELLLIKNIISRHDDVLTCITPSFMQNSNYNSNNNNNTVNINNQFNLQFFLNETCKNAMTITEFIKSIKLEQHHFESVVTNGVDKTLSNMVVNGLKSLDETLRPIHCTDQKRVICHVNIHDPTDPESTNPRWVKDEGNKIILKKIHNITFYMLQSINNNKIKKDPHFFQRNENMIYLSIIKKLSDSIQCNPSIMRAVAQVCLVNKNKVELSLGDIDNM
jgi:hypothetical protein